MILARRCAWYYKWVVFFISLVHFVMFLKREYSFRRHMLHYLHAYQAYMEWNETRNRIDVQNETSVMLLLYTYKKFNQNVPNALYSYASHTIASRFPILVYERTTIKRNSNSREAFNLIIVGVWVKFYFFTIYKSR